MTAKNAGAFDTVTSLIQFYPKVVTSIAFGMMDLAVSSMKPFGSIDSKPTEKIIADKPLHLHSGRVRSARQPSKRQAAASKTRKRATGRRKAA
jgi:hypothetical protein